MPKHTSPVFHLKQYSKADHDQRKTWGIPCVMWAQLGLSFTSLLCWKVKLMQCARFLTELFPAFTARTDSSKTTPSTRAGCLFMSLILPCLGVWGSASCNDKHRWQNKHVTLMVGLRNMKKKTVKHAEELPQLLYVHGTKSLNMSAQSSLKLMQNSIRGKCVVTQREVT